MLVYMRNLKLIMSEHRISTRVKAPTSITAPSIPPRSQGTYEIVAPNSNERVTLDGGVANKSKLLSCKRLLNISSLNVRSLKGPGKIPELANLFLSHQCDILGIVDHKLVHEDEVSITNLGSCTLITTSAWRTASNAALGGVGILIKNSHEKLISDLKSHSERILQVDINGNPGTSIIVSYSPVNGNDDAEEHYSLLSNVTNAIPKHNVILSIGDFNAHIGRDLALHSYHDLTNQNGHLLVDYSQECNLLITNTHFEKRKGKLWTYLSDMTGTKSQIDYIMVNRKWKNSIKDVEAFNNFSSIGSDHRVLTAKIKLSFRVTPARRKETRYDWNVLRDPDLSNQFSVEVKNRYSVLSSSTDNDDITQDYENLLLAHTQAAKELLPKCKKQKRKDLASDLRVREKRIKVQEAFNKYHIEPSSENQMDLQTAKGGLEQTYVEIEEERLNELIQQVEDAHSNAKHRLSWKLVNQISGRKNARKGMLKGKSKTDKLQKWYQHFSNLLGKVTPPVNNIEQQNFQPILKDLQINDAEFTLEDVEEAKKSLKCGKAAGPDGIPSDSLKLCNLDDIILKFSNELLLNQQKPLQWSIINLVPVPKTGDLGIPENYRGISLSSVFSKTVNKMILNRIQPKIDPHLRRNQNGFRPGRSTTTHILALRRLIEGVKRNNLQAIITFVDFKKAFDSVDREMMFKILQAYDVPPKLLNAIKLMHQDTKAKVISPDGETDQFDVLAGVLQGDTLAPYLFCIVVDYIMRKSIEGREEQLGFTIIPRRSRRARPVIITDLDFADDIALVSGRIDAAQLLLHYVETEASKIGLHLNAKKTEIQPFNITRPLGITTMNGEHIAEVNNFKYLGSWTESCEKDFAVRKARAWTACHKLKKIWTSKMRRNLKERLFISTVESVLLYGSETWTITKQFEKRINGCYTRMLRMALNVSWKQKLTNKALYGNLPLVTDKIRCRRMRIAGHCARHQEEVAHDLLLWSPTMGSVNRGRRPLNYIDCLLEDTGVDNKRELSSLMADRDVWKSRVKTEERCESRQK